MRKASYVCKDCHRNTAQFKWQDHVIVKLFRYKQSLHVEKGLMCTLPSQTKIQLLSLFKTKSDFLTFVFTKLKMIMSQEKAADSERRLLLSWSWWDSRCSPAEAKFTFFFQPVPHNQKINVDEPTRWFSLKTLFSLLQRFCRLQDVVHSHQVNQHQYLRY